MFAVVTPEKIQYFPNINVSEAMAECFRIAYERNTSAAIRELRRKLVSEN